jgi:hypothetical protein
MRAGLESTLGRVALALAAHLALFCGTCASAGEGEATVAAVPAQQCKREIPTGTNIAVTRCRSAEDAARDARATEAVGAAISRSGAIMRSTAGQ